MAFHVSPTQLQHCFICQSLDKAVNGCHDFQSSSANIVKQRVAWSVGLQGFGRFAVLWLSNIEGWGEQGA